MKIIYSAICLSLMLMLSATALAADEFALKCLSVKEGQVAILDDHLEPYFDTLQTMEMSAKTGEAITGDTLQQQRAECKRRYEAGVMAFTEQEVAAIRAMVGKLHPVLTKHYPKFAAMPWKFIKLSDKIEGGMPHTRDGYIVVSPSVCDMIVMSQQRSAQNPMAALPVVDLLLHEQMHVFQRTNPGAMDDLYVRVWGFKKMTNIPTSPWLTKHKLANPDAVECPWVLPDGNGKLLWPLVVLREGEGLKRMPMDFLQLAVDVVEKDGKFSVIAQDDALPQSVDLMSVPQFRKLFPLATSIYHPDEASANMFAVMCILNHFIPPEQINPAQAKQLEPMIGPLREWFGKNLGEKKVVSDVQ